MDKAIVDSMRQKIRAGARRNRKTSTFFAQLLINSKEIEIVDGEEWNDTVAELLSSIGMPQSYAPMVKSILWVVQELRVQGYVIKRSKN